MSVSCFCIQNVSDIFEVLVANHSSKVHAVGLKIAALVILQTFHLPHHVAMVCLP